MALFFPYLVSSFLILIFVSYIHPLTANPIVIFNFNSFTPNTDHINYSGDAFTSGDDTLQLTKNEAYGDLRSSVGRAVYSKPIQIYDPTTRIAPDFITHFEFIIEAKGGDYSISGDGLAFFIAPVGSVLPDNSTGQWLGLFNETTNGNPFNQIVAVEFDTFKNSWDPDSNHVGININSMASVNSVSWQTSLRSGQKGSAWVGYSSKMKSIYVYLSYDKDGFTGVPSLSYSVDLTTILPDTVIMGFSAATGDLSELHEILSWDLVIGS